MRLRSSAGDAGEQYPAHSNQPALNGVLPQENALEMKNTKKFLKTNKAFTTEYWSTFPELISLISSKREELCKKEYVVSSLYVC